MAGLAAMAAEPRAFGAAGDVVLVFHGGDCALAEKVFCPGTTQYSLASSYRRPMRCRCRRIIDSLKTAKGKRTMQARLRLEAAEGCEQFS
jgi:hypothetical protein